MGTVVTKPDQSAFYKAFLMARQNIDPADYGIALEREAFIDQFADAFNEFSRGTLSLDEMLLRPRTALQFCDTVRHRYGYYDLPDDIILRSIINRRKHG